MPGQVSRMEGLRPNSEMSLIGYVIAAGVGILLIPVAPFIAVLWLASKVVGKNERESEAESVPESAMGSR